MTSLEGAMRSHSLYLRYRVTIVQSGSVQSYKSYIGTKLQSRPIFWSRDGNFLLARREFSARRWKWSFCNTPNESYSRTLTCTFTSRTSTR